MKLRRCIASLRAMNELEYLRKLFRNASSVLERLSKDFSEAQSLQVDRRYNQPKLDDRHCPFPVRERPAIIAAVADVTLLSRVEMCERSGALRPIRVRHDKGA